MSLQQVWFTYAYHKVIRTGQNRKKIIAMPLPQKWKIKNAQTPHWSKEHSGHAL